MIEPYEDGAEHDSTKWWTDPSVQKALRDGSNHVESGQHSGGQLIRAGSDLILIQSLNGEPLRRQVKRSVYPNAIVSDISDALSVGLLPQGSAKATPASDTAVQEDADDTTALISRIRSIAPPALAAIDDLIASIQSPFHNGGPRSAEVENAVEGLRELHSALGELLTAVEAQKGIDAHLSRVRSLAKSLFSWSTDTFGPTVSGLPLAGTTALIAYGTIVTLDVLLGMPLITATAIGVASASANAAKVVKRMPERKP